MPPTGDFDDVSKVLADLWHFIGDKFRELALELGRSGDDYTCCCSTVAPPDLRPVSRRPDRYYQLLS
jgi:hypothetical protein